MKKAGYQLRLESNTNGLAWFHLRQLRSEQGQQRHVVGEPIPWGHEYDQAKFELGEILLIRKILIRSDQNAELRSSEPENLAI